VILLILEQWFLNSGACEVHKGGAKKVKISMKLILTRFYNHPSGQSITFDCRKCETMYEWFDSPKHLYFHQNVRSAAVESQSEFRPVRIHL